MPALNRRPISGNPDKNGIRMEVVNTLEKPEEVHLSSQFRESKKGDSTIKEQVLGKFKNVRLQLVWVESLPEDQRM